MSCDCMRVLLWCGCDGVGVAAPSYNDSSCNRYAFAKEPYKRDDILQKRPVILLMQQIRARVAAPCYRAALVSRIDTIVGLFCKRAL